MQAAVAWWQTRRPIGWKAAVAVIVALALLVALAVIAVAVGLVEVQPTVAGWMWRAPRVVAGWMWRAGIMW
jgi:hypothetical protein